MVDGTDIQLQRGNSTETQKKIQFMPKFWQGAEKLKTDIYLEFTNHCISSEWSGITNLWRDPRSFIHNTVAFYLHNIYSLAVIHRI